MKKTDLTFLKKISFLIVTLIVLPIAYANNGTSPLGYWKTVDDVTGQSKSILRIYQNNGLLYGQIVKLFPRPGHTENEVCADCQGMMHNKIVLGSIIMKELKQNKTNSAQWIGGKILDPMSGKTYRCNLTVVDKGQKMKVRGYIGFSLLGRTQTWSKVENYA